LLTVFPKANLKEENQSVFLEAYVSNLRNYPPEYVEKACDDWIKLATRFPFVADLVAACEVQAVRAKKAEDGNNKSWKRLSDEEFSTLDDRAKARELRLRAQTARLQAQKHKVQPHERSLQPEPCHVLMKQAADLSTSGFA
jgi:hypothetical protein